MAELMADRKESDGVAIAVTFLVAGALCIVAPTYFDAEGWRETAWHVAGAIAAVVGVLGLLVELSQSSAEKAMSDFAVGLTLLVLALLVSLALEAWEAPSPMPGLARSAVAFLVFFGVYGLVAGVMQLIRRVRESDTQWGSLGQRLVASLLGLIGLATAAVNLYASFQGVPK